MHLMTCVTLALTLGDDDTLAPRFTLVWPQAQRLAVGRARAPLAAAPSVWARRHEAVSRLDHAPWPHAAHAAAAATERTFWSRLSLRPMMQPGGAKGAAAAASGAAPVRGLELPRDHGCVTAISTSPSGVFLAAGTSLGTVLVWDVREDRPRAAWFQVGASEHHTAAAAGCGPLDAEGVPAERACG
jgi:hypothetical protein